MDIGKIAPVSNYMQQLGGQLGGLSQVSQYLNPSQVAIPMVPADWKKLSRETQIKLLDELGILNK